MSLHKIYRAEAVGLSISNYRPTLKPMFFEYVEFRAITGKMDILSITA